MPRIQLIFANYHCAAEIERCVLGLQPQMLDTPLEIVVVNNGGPKFDSARLRIPRDSSLLSSSPGTNTGYFGAMRVARAVAPGNGVRYRVLCNPDLEFKDISFFARLDALDTNVRCALVAPSIISTRTGLDQNPYMVKAPGATLRRRWRFVYSSWPAYVLNEWASFLRARVRQGKAYAATPTPVAERIHAPHGALMIFTEEFLRQETLLTEVPFLFAEEMFIGEICRRKGWTVQYEPSLKVWHREHATTGILPQRRRFELQRDAMRAFQRFIS